MRHLSALLASLLTMACWETSPDITARPAPPATPVAGMSCGAIVTDENNLMQLIKEQIAKLGSLLQYIGPQPQVVVWPLAKWAPGGDVRVRFLDGDEALQKFVMNVASEWTNGVRVNLITVTTGGDVRVTFKGKGLWSKIGRTALSIGDPSQPTMELGAMTATADHNLRRAYVLHEFGHALGALHEHQRRDVPLTWKPDVVYAHYQSLYGWSQAQVDEQVILPLQQKNVLTSPNFDPSSVMMYPIHKEFTVEQFVQPWNSQLTKWDLSVMAQMYQ